MAELNKWERLVRPMEVHQVQQLWDRARKEMTHPGPAGDWPFIMAACRREMDLRLHGAEAVG